MKTPAKVEVPTPALLLAKSKYKVVEVPAVIVSTVSVADIVVPEICQE